MHSSSDAARATSTYLFHLMGCALRDVAAEPKPDTFEWQMVYDLAVRNSVQGLAWFGAKTRDDVPEALRAQWEGAAKKTLYRRVNFDIEREAILADMAAHGLSYLPLKGVLLSDYYPRPEMRMFCDNDILYGYVEPDPDGGFRLRGATEAEQDALITQGVHELVSLMEARGYQTDLEHRGNHEVFLKKPFFNFEMHRKLVSYGSPLYAYYANPWKRAVQDTDDPHHFRFSHEDEYVYVVAHAYKHFDIAGCGVRILADLYAFHAAKGAGMDWGYVARELEAAGLAEFESTMRPLALEGLAGRELSSEEQELLWYMAGCGTYGTTSARIENAVNKMAAEGGATSSAKARYLRGRMFGENEDFMKENYPFFYRHKWSRPAFYVYRVFRALTRNQKSTLREVKAVLGKKREQ